VRRWVLALMVALAVVVGSLGALTVASAHDGSDGGVFNFASAFIDNLARRLGIGRDELVGAMRDAANDTIDQALQQGWLTQGQAQRLRDWVAQNEPGFPWGWHKGKAWLAPKVWRGVLVEAAAQVLGMGTDDLLAQLRQGKSLAQVAQERGMSTDEFKSRLLAQVDQRLAQLVQDGRITQQQADQLRQAIQNRIDAIVNTPGPICPKPWWGPRPESLGTSATQA